jgi:hypothetical protein
MQTHTHMHTHAHTCRHTHLALSALAPPVLYAGRLPGTQFELPFKCPMDHVMDLEGGWARAWPEPEFGAAINYREHGFLDNPRLPAWVRKHKVQVRPGAAWSWHLSTAAQRLARRAEEGRGEGGGGQSGACWARSPAASLEGCAVPP